MATPYSRRCEGNSYQPPPVRAIESIMCFPKTTLWNVMFRRHDNSFSADQWTDANVAPLSYSLECGEIAGATSSINHRTLQDLDDDDEDDSEEPPLVRRRLEFNCTGTSNDQLGTQLASASQQLIPMALVQPTVTTTTTTTDWMSSDTDIMSESEVEDDDNDSEFEQAMDVLASLAEIITRTVRVLRGNRRKRRNWRWRHITTSGSKPVPVIWMHYKLCCLHCANHCGRNVMTWQSSERYKMAQNVSRHWTFRNISNAAMPYLPRTHWRTHQLPFYVWLCKMQKLSASFVLSW